MKSKERMRNKGGGGIPDMFCEMSGTWPMDLSVVLRVRSRAGRVDTMGLCQYRWFGRNFRGRPSGDISVYMNGFLF
jgi:hypothetical protein